MENKIHDDPPAKVPPMKINIDPNAVPYRCKLRKYGYEEKEFLTNFIKELEAAGYIYKNMNSRWASPLHPVRKASVGFRATNDL